MATKFALAALIAVGFVGTAVSPSFAAKTVNNFKIQKHKDIPPACSLTQHKDFDPVNEVTNKKGLHTSVHFNNAQGWLTCNSKAKLVSVVTVTPGDHIQCEIKVDGKSGFISTSGWKKKCLDARIEKVGSKKGIDEVIRYDVSFDAYGKPIPADKYTVTLFSTAIAH